MSYGPTEFAHHKILGAFTEREDIAEKLERYCKAEVKEEERVAGIDVPRRQWQPKYVVAIDGSHFEQQYDKGFPGAEIGFVSVATVLIDVHRLMSEAEKASIDPAQFNQIQTSHPFTTVLAGTNMVREGEPDARATFRRDWFQILEETKPASDAESLLETYKALFAQKKDKTTQQCPLVEACGVDGRPSADYNNGKCACGKFDVFVSDALRIHEGFRDFAGNGECFGEVMRVLEHLFLVGVLRYMEKLCKESGNWSIFSDTAIVMDGSLAVFGHPAWLSQAIRSELERINDLVRNRTGEDILLVGIEKSGRFFDHWCRLDQKSNADFEREAGPTDTFEAIRPGRISSKTALLVNDPYIKRYIVPSRTGKIHGLDTYYGRPFLYKTGTGALIVGISPMLNDSHADRDTANLNQFPRLSDTLDLLDALVSMRYPNAVIPLIAAHAEAAIPLRMGEKVLDKLARVHVGKKESK